MVRSVAKKPDDEAPAKVAPFRHHIASTDERVLVWVAVRLVGATHAARLHTISRESARRIAGEVDTDDTLTSARIAAWKAVVEQLQAHTGEALTRAILRLSALLADPRANLSPTTLLELIQGLSSVQKGDVPGKGGGAPGANTPTMAIPAFLIRERRESPATPKKEPDGSTEPQ